MFEHLNKSDFGQPFSLYEIKTVTNCQTPVVAKSKRLGVDFVFPLSQESQPRQKLVVPGKLGV